MDFYFQNKFQLSDLHGCSGITFPMHFQMAERFKSNGPTKSDSENTMRIFLEESDIRVYPTIQNYWIPIRSFISTEW